MFLTMRAHSAFWLLIIATVIGFVWLFQGILAPFLVGIIIAYLLNPVVRGLSLKGVPRWISVLFILALFISALVLLLAITVPIFIREVAQLIELAPEWISTAHQFIISKASDLGFDFEPASTQQLVENLRGQTTHILQASKGVLSGLVAGGMALVSFATFIFLMPIVAFYMMVDWPKMTRQVDGLLPRHKAGTIRELLEQVDRTLAGFIRGQLSVCLILGLYYGIALTIADLRFGFAIGLMAGVLSIMPYVGSCVGIGTSLAVAWFTTHDMKMVAIVAAIFGVGQFMEGNFLTPKMVGGNIGLHPLWVIFALMAGGTLAGFVGMLVAVPVAAVIGVMVRFVLNEYKHSRYYTG